MGTKSRMRLFTRAGVLCVVHLGLGRVWQYRDFHEEFGSRRALQMLSDPEYQVISAQDELEAWMRAKGMKE